DRGVDLEVHLELAVRGQELDVSAQRGVECGSPARRREREHSEARLLLRERRCLLELWTDLLHRRPGREHLRVRRDGEEVLREPHSKVASRLRKPPAPTDDGKEIEERLHGESGNEARRGLAGSRQRGQRREPATVCAK